MLPVQVISSTNNTSVDDFINQFKKTNATQGFEGVKINLEPDEDDIEKLDEFASSLVDTYKKING